MSAKQLFKDYIIMPIFGESLYQCMNKAIGYACSLLCYLIVYSIIFHYRLLGNDGFHGIIAFNLLKTYYLQSHTINENMNCTYI